MSRVLLSLVLFSFFFGAFAGAIASGGGENPGIHGWYEEQDLDDQVRESSTHLHRLHFWFQSENPGYIHQVTKRVTDPASPSFRDWLDDEELRKIVAPRRGAVESLRRVLVEILGPEVFVMTLSKHGDFAHVYAPLSAWSRMFGTTLVWFRNDATSERIARWSGSHKVRVESSEHAARHPKLADITKAVFGLTDFYPIPTKHVTAGTPCKDYKGEQIDPSVLAARYGIDPPPHDSRRPGFGRHSQGVAAFEDAQFVETDVAQFQRDYNLSSVNVTVVGPNNGGYYGEASLDTQYIFSTGSGVNTYYLSQTNFDMLEWSWMTMNLTKPPTVLSISWGSGESGFDSAHMQAASLEFQKMGLTGRTILTASGDAGTGKHGGLLSPCKSFDPTWPASSPFVTAVGGTYLTEGGSSEIGWSYSGGGFSDVFERPSYQDNAVEAYTKTTTLPPSSHFNQSGRVTPDISAASTNFRLLTLGSYGCLSGTSASTPVVAGMISLINDELVSEGKPTVGFINPSLYAAGSVGFDITAGNNKAQFCPAGFNAEVGYDAVTGIGSPVFSELRGALLN